MTDDCQLTTEKGFTLIEILVVLAIMGVVMGILIGRGPMRSQGLQTRAAAGALVQSLRAARAQAIATDQDVAVVIDPGRHSFAADHGPVQTLAESVPISVLPPAQSLPGNIKSIRFSPDGSATGGQILIGSGHQRLAIAVEWLTGKVSVSNAP